MKGDRRAVGGTDDSVAQVIVNLGFVAGLNCEMDEMDD